MSHRLTLLLSLFLCVSDIFPNVERLASVPCPVLVIHGTDDQEVPLAHGYALFNLQPFQRFDLSSSSAVSFQLMGPTLCQMLYLHNGLLDESESREGDWSLHMQCLVFGCDWHSISARMSNADLVRLGLNPLFPPMVCLMCVSREALQRAVPQQWQTEPFWVQVGIET